ncbi:sulfatase-like hydrolase/transferase [Desulfovibrio sp. OttesenSCG-928-C06]|nr:sulfatase-like hydrolase/transferase [Desulfovibrio sp. OttesenSCG-928-C06]
MSEKKIAKNAVFIMLDTLPFNYLGAYGNEKIKTPNLDRFARRNTVFENAYSEGLPTVPVRRCLMTGRFTLPYGGWKPLEHDDTTLADVLWGRKWQTALIYDTPPMRLPKYGYSRGFDYVRFMPGQELDHTSFSYVPLDPGFKAIDYTSPSMVYDEKGELIDDDSTALLTELDLFLRQYQNYKTEADSYIAKVTTAARNYITDVRDKSRPFVMWMDSFDPHEPWDPPSVWLKEPCPYDPDYKGNPIVLTPWTPLEGRITEREAEHVRALCMEQIEMVDRWVGKLLDTLESEGLLDETLIIITSDHGQPMGPGEHGHGIMRKCRPWPYEELVHIPMLIHMPGCKPGQRIPAFVQNADVMPTILDAIGLLDSQESPDSGHGFPVYDWSDMHGESLLPLMRGEKKEIRDHAISGYYGKSWAIYTEDYSFVHWIANDVKDTHILKGEFADSEEMWSCTAGAKVIVPENDELYDRKNDPFQLKNIISEKPDVAEELLQKLKLRIGELKTM